MADQYEQWEHYIELIEANAEYAMSFVQQFYPQGPVPIYAVQSILPRLNALGEQGWELVHIEPVRLGNNGDILLGNDQTQGTRQWAHHYLCSFKRRRRI
ncbi:MAG TPA: hypothetical protein VKV37_16275 [Ktedonobacteraceae bacterium]|jgi:hypothetical protein|nr:hypothetical protein [Ktedonobacteraceae bacterium]